MADNNSGNIIQNEPVGVTGIIVAAITAVIALVSAFGLQVTPDQTAAIVGVVSAVAALVGFFLARRKVTPTKNVAAAVTSDGSTVAGPAAAASDGAIVTVSPTNPADVALPDEDSPKHGAGPDAGTDPGAA